MRTITLRGVAAGENRQGQSTDAEFQSRREKGLCFRCEEKYHAGHCCKVKEQKELRVLVVRENGEIEIVEEDYHVKGEEMTAIEVGNFDKPIIELSINFVVGLTNPRTIKVNGKIKDEIVIVLLDCGATQFYF